ncbi:MAG: phosphatidylserine decarboxylase [Bacteroidota bacterium]
MRTTPKHAPVVEELKQLLNDSSNAEMKNALVISLTTASANAKEKLNKELYKGLEAEFNQKAWPETVEQYYDYLDIYVKLVPNEAINEHYPDAWRSSNTKNGYNQKVYDLLCQFYYLVDQKNPVTNQTMQSFPKFAEWLEKFARSWGEFLDTEASFPPSSLKSFQENSMYNYDLYANHVDSWTTFNKFFYREFNDAAPVTGISPLRPIVAPNDNTIIASPADCTYKMAYRINEKGDVLGLDQKDTQVKLKHTHTIESVSELLNNSEYASYFNGGTFVHYFLGPFDYHRFHVPVSGQILNIAAVPGKVYLDVNMTSDGQFDAPDSSEGGYEFTQARGVVIMDAGGNVGKVAVIPIGMAQVSGVDMYTKLQGKSVVKGQEFGRFKFGGSDIIMLFEKSPEQLYMFKEDPGHNPIHFQYGQACIYVNS